MGTITFDFETRSEADLKKVGAWAYSQHPSTDVICCAWGFEDQPIQTWTPWDQVIPQDLFDLIEAGYVVEAHNVAFEYAIWHNVMAGMRYDWPLPAEDQWADLMAVASYYAMPPALDRLARACGFEGKDPEGGRLITKYSKLHLKTAKPDIPKDDLEKFVAYCVRDVQIEQSVSDFLGGLPERERSYFQLDQIVNRRGILLDLDGIARASVVVDKRATELEEGFRSITGLAPTQTDKFKDWLHERDCPIPNLQAETIDEWIEEDDEAVERGANFFMVKDARRALELRREISKASTKKLDAMARQVGYDGRARYQTRYHGAQTGRNTGAGFQPLNLVRGYEKMDPEQLVRDIMYGDPAWLDAVYGDAMEAVSKASRHWIMAAPGHRIMAGDFASIEAIGLAMLAGEEWKIEAFRRKEKMYERMAEKIYNLPPGTVTKETHPNERQDGKTGELAFGYQGALGAWRNFDRSDRHTDERVIEICKAWRAEHPMIVKFWRDLDDAAIEAVLYNRETAVRSIGFERVDEWLSMILPNGKRIWYFDPVVKWGMPRWHKPREDEDCANGTCSCKEQPRLTYMAQKEGQWKRVSTYGGKLAENATQATCREVLRPAALAAEAAGYPVVLTVYDEVVAEVPVGFGSKEEFKALMVGPHEDWYADWPISAEVWEGGRYKK